MQNHFQQRFQVSVYDFFRNAFLLFYVVIRDFMSLDLSSKSKFARLAKNISIFTVVIVCYILVNSLLIIPFVSFYVCLDGLLQLAYGKFYGGSLNGYDLLFEARRKKIALNIVMIFSCHNEPALLIEKLNRCAYELHQSNFKFSSVIRSILGYRFFLKNQVEFEKITNVLRYNDNEIMTKDNLIDYLEENCLTIEETQMWKATIFSQPILWDSRIENKQIAVILTFRHAIGDFPSIVGFMKRYFPLTEVVEKENIKYHNRDDNLNLSNVCLLRNPLVPLKNDIPFKVPNNYNSHIAMFMEESIQWIPKIKRIKQKYKVSFSDIFIAATTMSVYEYARQRNIDVKEISIGNVIRQVKNDIPKIMNGTYDFDKLNNKIGARFCIIPCETYENNVKRFLLFLQNHNKNLDISIDKFITSVSPADTTTYLPAVMINFLLYLLKAQPTIGVSNVIGLSESTCCGYNVDDMFFYAPNFMEIGFVFFINSYAGRMQIVATSKIGYVHNRQELQNILNNALKLIDELENS